MKIIDNDKLNLLIDDARTSPRLRKNLNIHADLSDPVQRLCNAFEPGTYVRPHRHPEKDKWELFVVLQGEALVLVFDEAGMVQERTILSDQGPNYLIEIPSQTWHTVTALQEATVLFEVKPGPYIAVSDKDFASWAPAEGEPQVDAFVKWMLQADIDDKPPGR